MNDNDKNLIIKYITKQASPEETELVKYLINTSKSHEDFYIQYYEAWQKSLNYDLSRIDADKAYDNFLKGNITKTNSTPVVGMWKKYVAAASIVLICAAGGYFGFQKSNQTVVAQAPLSEIRVPKGATKTITLPDGTNVSINAGSYLKLEEGFGKTSRTVFLDGEAYFDIAKGKVPFLVRTSRHTIRDIGTVFNVKAYSDDLDFETAVIEGEVSVEGKLSGNSSRPETISVTKQQVLKLNYSPAPTADRAAKGNVPLAAVAMMQLVSAPQLEAYTGWTEDILVFEGKTFQEISRIMERKYDVEIIINDPQLREYAYTGSFKNVDQVDKALKILKETTDINYSKNGRAITIWADENLTEKRL